MRVLSIIFGILMVICGICCLFVPSLVIAWGINVFIVIMAAVYVIMALLVINVMTPLIIFGMGTCAFINSLLLKNILIQCEEKALGQDEDSSSDVSEDGLTEQVGDNSDDFSADSTSARYETSADETVYGEEKKS